MTGNVGPQILPMRCATAPRAAVKGKILIISGIGNGLAEVQENIVDGHMTPKRTEATTHAAVAVDKLLRSRCQLKANGATMA